MTVLETSNNSILITGGILKPFTLYYCKVAAFTIVGVGPYSENVLVNTPEDGKILIFCSKYLK